MMTYDEQTQIVTSEDGSTESVWEVSTCPTCGGYLSQWIGGDGPDMVMCHNALGSETTCDFIIERSTAFARDEAEARRRAVVAQDAAEMQP